MSRARSGDASAAKAGRQRAGAVVKGLLREPEPEAGPYPSVEALFEDGSLEARLFAGCRGARIRLAERDAADTGGLSKKQAHAKLSRDQEKLDALQQVLYAEHKRRVLLVLQGMDTSGKDGTIRHVMRSLNPQGVEVASFKKPTAEEKRHHFLWRIERALPGPGMIGIFNRSHYEDILVPSVRGKFPAAQRERRLAEILEFEKALTARGFVVLKFFLHISKDEQRRRLQERLDEPAKNWKFSPEDLETRALWPRFMAAYEGILERTSVACAPWFIVPADHKWYRDFVVGRILRHALKHMNLSYPAPPPGLPRTIPR